MKNNWLYPTTAALLAFSFFTLFELNTIGTTLKNNSSVLEKRQKQLAELEGEFLTFHLQQSLLEKKLKDLERRNQKETMSGGAGILKDVLGLPLPPEQTSFARPFALGGDLLPTEKIFESDRSRVLTVRDRKRILTSIDRQLAQYSLSSAPACQ